MTEQKKTGTVYPSRNADGSPRRWPNGWIRYRGKVTWPDGKRQDIGVPERCCYDEDRALEFVKHRQEQIDAHGAEALAELAPKMSAKPSGKPDASWTIGAYKTDFFEARRASGRVEDVDSEEGRLKHLAELDGITMGALTTPAYRAAMIRVRDHAKKHDGTPLAPRSIIHVHRTFALMFRNAAAEGVVPVNPCVLLPGDLPAKKDKDPKWRKTARFSCAELSALISDERIPEDRRAFWALMFLGSTRFGEAAARRWRDYDTTTKPLGKLTIETSYSTKKRLEKDTKTEVPREMPVHPALAAILATWKASGWVTMMGRKPTADDLIVPSREGRNRNVNHMLRRFKQDCERIGLRARRQHDTRRTFISLAREGGASDLLKWCTHGAPGEIIDQYTTPSWEKLCAEVLCVTLADAPSTLSPTTTDKSEKAEAVTASALPVDCLPELSTVAFSSTITSGADGTRKRLDRSHLRIDRGSCVSVPPTTERIDGNGQANEANARGVDSGVDTSEALDLRRASALAKAVEAFVEAGLIDHARPLARELAEMLREAEGAQASIVSLGAERTRRA